MNERAERVNDLIIRIANGDKEALGELYDEFSGLLFAMAKKYLFDKSKAEDVVGEVLLRLVKSSKNFRRGGNGLNWLFKSIHNEAVNVNKKDGRNSFENIDYYPDIIHVINPEEKLVNDITLKEALKCLSDIERKALYYKLWEGLTVREIGKVLGVPRSSAQDIISGAFIKLETFFELP